MSSFRKIQRNPKVWLGTIVAASIAAIGYKMANSYLESCTEHKKKEYTNKSIALTLSHSVLSSKLPLNDILMNSENVTFILPPNLSMEDLLHNMANNYSLPNTLVKNYKLLECENIQGFYAILKNLQPDILLVCADDLGVLSVPKDMNRFIKEIITIEQNIDDVYLKLSPLFIH